MNIILIAKKTSGYDEGKEVFCGSYSFYDKKRYSYEYYVRGSWKERGFFVVGKGSETGEIFQSVLNEKDLVVIVEDNLEERDYKIIKESLLLRVENLKNFPDDPIEKQFAIDKIEMLENTIQKLKNV